MTTPETIPLATPTNSSKLANFAERVVWTLVQAASAEALIAGWEAVRGDIGTTDRALWLIGLTTLLAAVKNAATQAFGSPTGATLPEGLAPVLAEEVVARVQGDAVVAATASALPDGTPVSVVGSP